MRFIPRKYHAVLDYCYGVFVMISPWVLDFGQHEAATDIAYLWGLAIILISINTDYEGGVTKALSMSGHLNADVVGGLLLAVSPWLFGFYQETLVFHVGAGIFSVLAGLLTINRSQHTNSEHVDDMLIGGE